MTEKYHTTDKPHWAHNCDHCEYLGSFDWHDLYYCMKRRSVGARYGNEDIAIKFGTTFIREDRHIREAFFRARQAGYIKESFTEAADG